MVRLLRPRFIGALRSSTSIATSHKAESTDPLFNYTSGRWFWNERAQLAARFRRFNVEHLRKIACLTVGSTECISLEKIGEGNYNKAYRLVMNDGQRVIAKIPHPNAGPAQYTTASEVATMDFARTVLDLPVPKVLAWNSASQNSVESEYIIMEEAKGRQLHELWQKMNIRTKRGVVHEIVEVEKKLLSMSFNKYATPSYGHTNSDLFI